jgi:hypothetical protein
MDRFRLKAAGKNSIRMRARIILQACFAFAADRDRRLNVIPDEVAL